jgi:hypothetical protein
VYTKFGTYGGTTGNPRGYSNAGETIRVDTLHKLAIIAVSGKPGNPFLRVSATFESTSGLKNLPDFTQTPGAFGPLYRSVARGMGERQKSRMIPVPGRLA